MEPPTTVNRTLALALAVTVVVGPLVGFAVARVTDRDRVEVQAGAGDDDGHGIEAAPEPAPAPTEAGAEGARRLLTRDVGDIRVRVYEVRSGPYDDGNPLWEPPEWCTSSVSLVLEVSTPELVGMESVDYSLRPDAGAVSHAGVLGTMEGRPLFVAVVRDEAATDVTVEFPGGATDSMAPVEGVAVLVADAPAGTVPTEEGPSFTATIASPSGPRTETVRPWWSRPQPSDTGVEEECQPPPPVLPPAGEQPADPDAARAAIAAAYDGLYGSVGDTGGRVHLEDADALAEAFERLDEQGLPIPEGTPVHIEIQELVFDRPDHAWLRYDLVVDGFSRFDDRIGEAVVVEGTWRVANATLCQDLALGGVQC